MSCVTTYIIALREQAMEFVRFCHAHACDLVELPDEGCGKDGGGATSAGRVHAFTVVDREFDQGILPEAIFGRWPYPFDSADTLRDLLEDLVESHLVRGENVSIMLIASTPEHVRESSVLQGVLTLLKEHPHHWRRVWLAAAITSAPWQKVPEDFFRTPSNMEGVLDSIFFLAPARRRGVGVLSETHWPGLRLLIDIARDDAEARKFFLNGASVGPFWVPPDRVQCDMKRRPEALAAFLNRAVHAIKVFDRGRSERESEELNRFYTRLSEFERQLQEFEMSPSEEKALNLDGPAIPKNFLVEHVIAEFESFAKKVRDAMEDFRENRLHQDFISRSGEVEERRKRIMDKYFEKQVLIMPFADMPLDKKTEDNLRVREERLKQQAEELQKKARELRVKASLEMHDVRVEDIRNRTRKLYLSHEYHSLSKTLDKVKQEAKRIFPVFSTEHVIGVLGMLLVILMIWVHDQTTSLVSLGEDGAAIVKGLMAHFKGWFWMLVGAVLVLLFASLAWGGWRRWFGERKAYRKLSGNVVEWAGKVEEAFRRLSENAAAYLFHSGGALMAQRMYEHLRAQRTGNIFRKLEEQAQKLWPRPNQADIEEQALDKSIVDAFTHSLQQAARRESLKSGQGRKGMTFGYQRLRIARNAMFHLMREWLTRHEARPWQIAITGEANVSSIQQWGDATLSAPLKVAGTYGMQDAGDRKPCFAAIVPLAMAKKENGEVRKNARDATFAASPANVSHDASVQNDGEAKVHAFMDASGMDIPGMDANGAEDDDGENGTGNSPVEPARDKREES